MKRNDLFYRIKIAYAIARGYVREMESTADGALILCYHGLSKGENDDAQYTIRSGVLKKHLKFLLGYYKPQSLDQIANALIDGDSLPGKWVALTFDDALLSQVTLAPKILERFQTPWALAVPAGLIGSGRTIWSYELNLLIRQCWKNNILPSLPGCTESMPARTIKDKIAAVAHIRRFIFQSSPQIWRPYLERLIDEAGRQSFLRALAQSPYRMADWDAIERLADAGVVILSHGWSHAPANDEWTEEDIKTEFCYSRDLIESKIGRLVNGYALPNGCLSLALLERLKVSGYRYCLTVNSGRVTCETDPFLMPRISAERPANVLRYMMSKEVACPQSLSANAFKTGSCIGN